MSNYLTGRDGLAVRAADGLRLGDGDVNQIIDHGNATRRFLLDVIGGEGVYGGGASSLSDLTNGANYPAVKLALVDDSGVPWFYETTSNSVITFNVTSATNGALYAVPVLLTGVSPLAASGTVTSVKFIADNATATAPAHSLLLGTGVIASSAFTSYTKSGTLATPLVNNAIFKNATQGTVTTDYYLTIVSNGATYRIPAYKVQ